MTPLKLTLKGFIGIRDGMGRDEFEFDLETVHGALVALTGPNGIGKTTVLDNLQPYRLMPSRASSYSPGAFSFWGQVYGAEASKELIWSHGSNKYKSILIFRTTGKTQKPEAYLQILVDGSWQPAVAGTVTSDGKTSTYDICIEAILGAPELYFTAAFSAQGRRLLSAYSNGEIKSLLSSLLGLGRLGELATQANAKRLDAERNLQTIRDRGNEFVGLSERIQQHQQALDGHHTLAAGHTSRRDTARAAIGDATGALGRAQAQASAVAESETRRQGLRQQLETLNSQETKELTEARATRDNAGAAVTDAEKRIAAETGRLNTQLQGQQQELKVQEGLLSRGDEVAKAVETVAAASLVLAGLDIELEACEAEGGKLKDAPAKAASLKQQVLGIENEIKSYDTQLEALKRRSALVERVPCAGTDLQNTCELLADARNAKNEITALETKRYIVNDGLAEAQSDLLDAESQAQRHADLQKQWRELSDKRGAVNKEWNAAKDLAAMKASVDQAETSATRIRGSITDTQAAIATATAAGTTELTRLKEVAAAANLKPVDVQTRFQELRAPIQKDLDSIPTADAAGSGVATAQAALDAAKASLNDVEKALDAAKAVIAKAEADLQQLQALAEKAASYEADVARASDDIAHWMTLGKALGPNGVVALVIDDAGPSLAALTNDLLRSCYGSRFSVRIETQHENKDGSFAEDFDITVFDAERDETKSITDMSGGERIWINEALSRAIALYQAQQSQRHYEVTLTDEADGALDAEKKQQFMDMKRQVLKIGGYSREIFISHSPATWDLADARIDLGQYITKPETIAVAAAA